MFQVWPSDSPWVLHPLHCMVVCFRCNPQAHPWVLHPPHCTVMCFRYDPQAHPLSAPPSSLYICVFQVQPSDSPLSAAPFSLYSCVFQVWPSDSPLSAPPSSLYGCVFQLWSSDSPWVLHPPHCMVMCFKYDPQAHPLSAPPSSRLCVSGMTLRLTLSAPPSLYGFVLQVQPSDSPLSAAPSSLYGCVFQVQPSDSPLSASPSSLYGLCVSGVTFRLTPWVHHPLHCTDVCFRYNPQTHPWVLHHLHCTVVCFRYDPQTNQWSSDVAPTSSCRTSVGVAVLDNFMYAVGGQDGVSCLNFVERLVLQCPCMELKLKRSKEKSINIEKNFVIAFAQYEWTLTICRTLSTCLPRYDSRDSSVLHLLHCAVLIVSGTILRRTGGPRWPRWVRGGWESGWPCWRRICTQWEAAMGRLHSIQVCTRWLGMGGCIQYLKVGWNLCLG